MAVSNHTGVEAREYCGDILKRSSGTDYVLSEFDYRTVKRVPKHCHHQAHFCMLLSGSYQERIGSLTIEYRPNTIVFHPRYVPHSDLFGLRGARVFIIDVMDSLLEQVSDVDALGVRLQAAHSGALAILANRLLLMADTAESTDDLAMEGLVNEMMGLLARRRAIENHRPRWLGVVEEFLRAEFARHLTLNHLAAAVGVNPIHMSRVFRRYHGKTVAEYVNELRVEFASDRLAADQDSLAGIAQAAGFADQSHFNRVFKKFMGVPPGVYRSRRRWHSH